MFENMREDFRERKKIERQNIRKIKNKNKINKPVLYVTSKLFYLTYHKFISANNYSTRKKTYSIVTFLFSFLSLFSFNNTFFFHAFKSTIP